MKLASLVHLHCTLLHVGTNGIVKTAMVGTGAEKKGKELPGSVHYFWIPQPFVCPLPGKGWCESALRRSGTTVCCSYKAEQCAPIVVAGPMSNTNA